MSGLPHLCALWVEGRLSYVEQACLASAVRMGHPVTLFTYFGVEAVPNGVDVRDGRDVMPESLMKKDNRRRSWALGADIFRYWMLKKGYGVWIDCDAYFVRPLDLPIDDVIFGWQKNGLINNGILYIPQSHPLLADLLAFVDEPYKVPHWQPLKRRIGPLMRKWLRLKPMALEEHRWGIIGPRALSAFALRRGLGEKARPQEVFYPLPPKKNRLLFEPGEAVEAFITDRTISVHLWNEMIKDLKRSPPSEGSFMARICAAEGVSPRDVRP